MKQGMRETDNNIEMILVYKMVSEKTLANNKLVYVLCQRQGIEESYHGGKNLRGLFSKSRFQQTIKLNSPAMDSADVGLSGSRIPFCTSSSRLARTDILRSRAAGG